MLGPFVPFDRIAHAAAFRFARGFHVKPLARFGATDPEYLPECKDESHPGTRKFKLEIMNSEAESLDDENPCKLPGLLPILHCKSSCLYRSEVASCTTIAAMVYT